MLGAALKFFGLGSGISWIAYAVIAALSFGAGVGGTWWIAHQRIVAKDALLGAATQRADLNGQDAQRWRNASDERDRAMADLRDAYAQQSAAVEAGQAKAQAIQAQLDQAQQDNAALQSQADQLSADLEAEAKKAPGDVRPIGPIVAKRVQQLFQ